MQQIRRANDRGKTQIGWLDSRHSFSFGGYHDSAWMGFGPLRVINEDRVAPGQGFGTHAHRDMEIISYVIDGELSHRDSMGNGSTIRPGDLQRMSAGRGVQHSEFNPSATDEVHFLQIWIIPRQAGLTPEYEEKQLNRDQLTNQLCLIGSADARDDSVRIHQDVDLYASQLSKGETLTATLASGRKAWLQVISGSLEANTAALSAGDGLALVDEPELTLQGLEAAHILLFDMAP